MNKHIKRDLIKQGMTRYIKKATPTEVEIIDVLLIALIILGALIAIVHTL